MNDDQLGAVHKVLGMRDYAVVLGMPGTGKTTTIVHIIKARTRSKGGVACCCCCTAAAAAAAPYTWASGPRRRPLPTHLESSSLDAVLHVRVSPLPCHDAHLA